MLTLQVIRREVQGDVVLLTLAHSEGIALPAFRAGRISTCISAPDWCARTPFAAIRRTGSTISWAS